MLLRIFSWNINGYRALVKKEEGSTILKNTLQADILGIQEARISAEHLPVTQMPEEHIWDTTVWSHSTVKKGYSGVAVFSTHPSIRHSEELPEEQYQGEGRLLHVEYPWFHFLNVYFPNGQNGSERLAYKMGYYDTFLTYAESLRKSKPIVAVGDFNTAHTPLDLSNPKQNEKESGFLPEERAWIDTFTASGYVDTFRYFHPDTPEQYSWWSYKTKARERNVGWRIDYIFISQELVPYLQNAWIASDVYGSDHCPVAATLKLPI